MITEDELLANYAEALCAYYAELGRTRVHSLPPHHPLARKLHGTYDNLGSFGVSFVKIGAVQADIADEAVWGGPW